MCPTEQGGRTLGEQNGVAGGQQSELWKRFAIGPMWGGDPRHLGGDRWGRIDYLGARQFGNQITYQRIVGAAEHDLIDVSSPERFQVFE